MKEEEQKDKAFDLDAMERLAEVMNDTPHNVKIGNENYPIRALKAGTQWLIAEKSAKILKAEQGNMNDVIKQFAVNIPTVVDVITLAILNDKDAIFAPNGKDYSDRFKAIRETIMWKTNPNDWISLIVEIINMLSFDYFFDITNAIGKIREMALARKMTMEERELLSAEQNTGK